MCSSLSLSFFLSRPPHHLAAIDLGHGVLLDILQGMSDHFQQREGSAIECEGHRLRTSVVIVQAHLEIFKQHPTLVVLVVVFARLGAKRKKLPLMV